MLGTQCGRKGRKDMQCLARTVPRSSWREGTETAGRLGQTTPRCNRLAGDWPPCLGQSRQVYAVAWPRAGSRPGSGSREMYLQERYARMSAQGDQLLRGRCESEIMDASSSRTTRQVDHVPHAQSLADFAQLRASGREESAEQSVAVEFLQPSLPALSTATQPLEDAGHLRRN
jgi:hypothetical protein